MKPQSPFIYIQNSDQQNMHLDQKYLNKAVSSAVKTVSVLLYKANNKPCHPIPTGDIM